MESRALKVEGEQEVPVVHRPSIDESVLRLMSSTGRGTARLRAPLGGAAMTSGPSLRLGTPVGPGAAAPRHAEGIDTSGAPPVVATGGAARGVASTRFAEVATAAQTSKAPISPSDTHRPGSPLGPGHAAPTSTIDTPLSPGGRPTQRFAVDTTLSPGGKPTPTQRFDATFGINTGEGASPRLSPASRTTKTKRSPKNIKTNKTLKTLRALVAGGDAGDMSNEGDNLPGAAWRRILNRQQFHDRKKDLEVLRNNEFLSSLRRNIGPSALSKGTARRTRGPGTSKYNTSRSLPVSPVPKATNRIRSHPNATRSQSR
jgi:hypothetical protein